GESLCQAGDLAVAGLVVPDAVPLQPQLVGFVLETPPFAPQPEGLDWTKLVSVPGNNHLLEAEEHSDKLCFVSRKLTSDVHQAIKASTVTVPETPASVLAGCFDGVQGDHDVQLLGLDGGIGQASIRRHDHPLLNPELVSGGVAKGVYFQRSQLLYEGV